MQKLVRKWHLNLKEILEGDMTMSVDCHLPQTNYTQHKNPVNHTKM